MLCVSCLLIRQFRALILCSSTCSKFSSRPSQTILTAVVNMHIGGFYIKSMSLNSSAYLAQDWFSFVTFLSFVDDIFHLTLQADLMIFFFS